MMSIFTRTCAGYNSPLSDPFVFHKLFAVGSGIVVALTVSVPLVPVCVTVNTCAPPVASDRSSVLGFCRGTSKYGGHVVLTAVT